MNDSRFSVSGWEDDLEDIDEDRNPPETPKKEILFAAENGQLDRVKCLLDEDPALISSSDEDGYTPLHRACYNNHTGIVDLLLCRGADVAAKTQMKWQPLHSCCQWNQKECAVRLIQHGADVNASSEGGQTPLHIAASHGASYETVQLLLMNPYVKPEMLNNNNETAYDIAKRSSNYYHIFDMANPALQGIGI